MGAAAEKALFSLSHSSFSHPKIAFFPPITGGEANSVQAGKLKVKIGIFGSTGSSELGQLGLKPFYFIFISLFWGF